jgi:3-hydroxybutyryl-CoA dehydratase
VVTERDIAEFANSVGDDNPLHSDRAYAARTSFREPIAPGLWTAGLVSGVIGTRLPGPGSIYATQDLKFLKPVKVGDTITARVEVMEVLQARNRVRLKTTCVNQLGGEVLSGEAWVLPPKLSNQPAGRTTASRTLSLWMFQPFACAAQAASLWLMLGAAAFAWGLAPAPTSRARR